MNNHPNNTPASPSLASPIFDASFDSIESLTTTFASSVVPTLETTTVTEVALGYHRNQQYSITAMTTSTGAVAERYAYTAYGQPTILNASGSVLTSSAVGNRYTYTGREWDETLGLHHFRARWMSPLAGRFLGRDPIGYLDGFNLFGMVFVPELTDPSGEKSLRPLPQRPSQPPSPLRPPLRPRPKVTPLRVDPTFPGQLPIWRPGCPPTLGIEPEIHPRDLPHPVIDNPERPRVVILVQPKPDEDCSKCMAAADAMYAACRLLNGDAKWKCIENADDFTRACARVCGGNPPPNPPKRDDPFCNCCEITIPGAIGSGSGGMVLRNCKPIRASECIISSADEDRIHESNGNARFCAPPNARDNDPVKGPDPDHPLPDDFSIW